MPGRRRINTNTEPQSLKRPRHIAHNHASTPSSLSSLSDSDERESRGRDGSGSQTDESEEEIALIQSQLQPSEWPRPRPCQPFSLQSETTTTQEPMTLVAESANVVDAPEQHICSGCIDVERLAAQVKTLEQEVSDLKRINAANCSDRDCIVESLRWLDETVRRLDPVGTQAGGRPPLPYLNSPRKQGGGPKFNTPLQTPFLAELRQRMGLKHSDPLPAFEDPAPTLGGSAVLRIDWTKPAEAYRDLVQTIVAELDRENPAARQHIEALGGQRPAVNVCMTSFTRLQRRYYEQNRSNTNTGKKEARAAKRRRSSRVKKKCDKRTNYLTRNDALWRQYHRTKLAFPEAASVEVTDTDEQDLAGHKGPTVSSVAVGTSQATVDEEGTRFLAPLRTVVPCWRSLELHRVLVETDRRSQNEQASQPLPPMQMRPRRGRFPVHYPPAEDKVEPLSSSVQRWMVSSEFANLFPAAVEQVSLNTIIPGETNSTILSPEQWGQHPPYEVGLRTHLDNNLDPALFFDVGDDDEEVDNEETGVE